MLLPRRLLVFVVAAAAAVALLSAPARAQSAADDQALARYRLSEATMAKFIAASRAMAAASRAHRDTAANDADDDENQKDPTIAEIAAFYDSQPDARRALARANLTSREYVIFMLALFQAGMAAWLVEEHGWDKLPPEIARENVVFYQRHKAQLDSLTAELRKEGDGPP